MMLIARNSVPQACVDNGLFLTSHSSASLISFSQRSSLNSLPLGNLRNIFRFIDFVCRSSLPVCIYICVQPHVCPMPRILGRGFRSPEVIDGCVKQEVFRKLQIVFIMWILKEVGFKGKHSVSEYCSSSVLMLCHSAKADVNSSLLLLGPPKREPSYYSLLVILHITPQAKALSAATPNSIA